MYIAGLVAQAVVHYWRDRDGSYASISSSCLSKSELPQLVHCLRDGPSHYIYIDYI